MDREIIIGMLNTLRDGKASGLRRYKLMEHLRLQLYPASGRGFHRRGWSRRYASWFPRRPRPSRVQRECVGCGYSLSGLDSVLGEEIEVGPALCPECGVEYPALR